MQNRLKESKALVLALLSLTSCSDPDNWADRGYDDGYTVGWRSVYAPSYPTLVYGEWGREEYVTNYRSGEIDGALDARINGCV